MNRASAEESLRYMLGVYTEEENRFCEIDKAVKPPREHELAARYNIEFGSKNYERHMQIAKQAFNPLLELTLNTYGQSLKVDNYYRSNADSGAPETAGPWKWWQANRMDGRQTGLHYAALKYGLSYASALPADLVDTNDGQLQHDRAVTIGTHSPRRITTLYGESFDQSEYPILALQQTRNGFRLYDEKYVYFFGAHQWPKDWRLWDEHAYWGSHNLHYIERREHGVGVTPIVRYLDRMMVEGEESGGIVESMIGMADRINMSNYQEGLSRHWSAFKQRYVIGWMPSSEQEALNQKVSDTWFFKDSKNDVSVGQFGETDLSQYVDSRKAMESEFAANAQLPATIMGANVISNVSAEGLAALERGKELSSSELQTSLGESHEQLFRLCAHIAGDHDAAKDYSAEVQWRDTSAKTIAQTVDALGKMATMLGIPVEELWSEIPGWTHQQVERAKRAKRKQEEFDPFAGVPGMGDFGGQSDSAVETEATGGGGVIGGSRKKQRGKHVEKATTLKDGDGDGAFNE